MKTHAYILLLALAAMMGCADDDDNFNLYLLSYDGENSTAPALPVGEYEAAAHYDIDEVRRHPGTELVAIEYFIYDRPEWAEVRISESNGNNTPGNIVFSQVVTNQIIPFSWNRVNLGDAQALNDGLWLSVYFENSVEDLRTMGCDAGPSTGEGDWFYDSFDDQWRTYQARTQESINWNIRGVLQDR